MTTEELWNNLKVILERQENDIKEIKIQIAEIPEMKVQIRNLVENEIPQMKKQLEEIPEMKKQIHNIKDVNLVAIIKNQTTIMEKLDKYIKQNEDEHKKFEYRITNLEWENKVAN